MELLNQYLPYLLRCLRDAAFREGTEMRHYDTMKEVGNLFQELDVLLTTETDDFLKLSNIHNFLGYLLHEWNEFVIHGCFLDIGFFDKQWKSLINPPINRRCSKCKWSVCQCKSFLDMTSIRFGNIKCFTCKWMDCKCQYFGTKYRIRFGSRLKKSKGRNDSKISKPDKILAESEKQPVKKEGIDESTIEKRKDIIEFLMRCAKKHCKKCFVSHTPLKKWCRKETSKAKIINSSKDKLIDDKSTRCSSFDAPVKIYDVNREKSVPSIM